VHPQQEQTIRERHGGSWPLAPAAEVRGALWQSLGKSLRQECPAEPPAVLHMPMLPQNFFTASCAMSVIMACGAMRT